MTQEEKDHKRILKKAGWSVQRVKEYETVYLTHKRSGRIVDIETFPDEGFSYLVVLDEFMKKENAK